MYSDRTFSRIMLLISAIANNPGIAPSGTGVSPMAALLNQMRAIAIAHDIEWEDWSEHTIRDDLKDLRRFGILRSGTALRGGYYLGANAPPLEPVIRPTRRLKSKLFPGEIVKLRDEGETLEAIAQRAGISKEAVRKLEAKGRA